MAIYGATGADLARRGMTIGQGISNMGQNMMKRAAFLEQQRQFNFKSTYQMLNDMVNSENYKGDWTKFFNKNPGVTKKLLSTMYPYDPDKVDFIYQGLSNGNQSAQQIFTQSVEQQLQSFTMDAMEQQQQAQSYQQMGDQGAPQGQGVSMMGGEDIWSTVQEQQQQQQQSQGQAGKEATFSMPSGTTEGAEPLSEKEQAIAEMYRANLQKIRSQGVPEESLTQLGGALQGIPGAATATAAQDFIQKRKAKKATMEWARETWGDQLGAVRDPDEMLDVLEERTPVKGPELTQTHQEFKTKYRDAGGGNVKSLEEAKQVAKKAFGFNETDIHDATRELKQDGEIKNEAVKSFMDEHGIPATAEGLAQVTTFMNTAMMGKEMPATADTNFGLAEKHAERYRDLANLLGATPPSGGRTEAPVQGPQGMRPSQPTEQPVATMAPETPLREQFETALKEDVHPGSEVDVHNENSTHFFYKVDGKTLRMQKSAAIDRGYVKLSPAAMDVYTHLKGEVSAGEAIDIDKLINNGINSLTPSEKANATKTTRKASVYVKEFYRNPRNKRTLQDATKRVAQSISGQSADPIFNLLVSTMPGDTYEDQYSFLMRSMAPTEVQEERRFAEVKRQFDEKMELDWNKLSFQEWLARVEFSMAQGMQEAIEGIALADKQEAALKFIESALPEALAHLRDQADGDPEKYHKLLMQMINRDALLKGMYETSLESVSSIMGVPVGKLKETIPAAGAFLANLRHRLGGGEEAPAYSFGEVEGAGFGGGYSAELEALMQDY